MPGWILETLDGTKYHIEREPPPSEALAVYRPDPSEQPIEVKAHGPPRLTRIEQRSGGVIEIGSSGIKHKAQGTNLTRSVLFQRDEAGRITALRDPVAGSNGLPVVKYIYHQETGNLLQVQRLTDRAAGTYTTTKYHYDHPKFPHYLTSVEDPRGIPLARNEYDDAGRLTAVVDADGKRTEFIHSVSNRLEITVDRLGYTNVFAYDLRGNVTATTNAVGGITLDGV